MTEKIDATNLPGRKRSEEILPRTPQHETEGSLLPPHEVAPPDYRLHRQDELASDPVIPAEIVGLGDNHGALASRKSVLPGHNLDESELLIGVPNHGCSACCSRHNHCDECHETPFPSSNVHLNFHYDLSCSHRSFFHPELDEFAADCTCECGCQCGNCRRSRELIYAIVEPPLGAWSLTFEVINESLSFQSGEPIFLVEFESLEKAPEDQWSIAIEGSVDELNGPLIPVEFEMPDELRVMLEAEMRTAIRNACQRLMAEMTAEVAEATAPSKPPMSRLPVFDEVAAANYTLDLRAEFATDAAIPATVVEIIDDDDTLRVTATFAGHPELNEIGVFVISLNGDQVDCVSVTYFEPEKGDYGSLPMAGASKGVFAELIEKHRHDLDMLRATVAHDRDIDLRPADPDYLAPTARNNNVRTKPMNNETAMHKRYWVIGRQRKDDSGGGYKRHVGPLDLDTPGATLTFDRERLEHMYSSADDTEVPEPDWNTFDKISAELGAPHVIRLGLRAQASEKLPGADAITVTNAHVYLGFATLERYGAAADLLMRPRS